VLSLNPMTKAHQSNRSLCISYMWQNDVSISDVLKFKRALSYMDEAYPFGEDFGPAANRNDCIKSACTVYNKLLNMAPQSPVLSFDVLQIMTINDDGEEDLSKKQALRRIFRPDARNQLTLLAFIQSCDSIYKRLCYLRASVGNLSVMDKVLEGMIDGFFYFVLSLILLSILEFDPWTLLLSITSLLVSISFAVGSSVSKFVEVSNPLVAAGSTRR
jgi:hypothetical protein